jgi:hypothetical protein
MKKQMQYFSLATQQQENKLGHFNETGGFMPLN